MAEIWFRTVFSDSTSRRAISWLPKPVATNSSTPLAFSQLGKYLRGILLVGAGEERHDAAGTGAP
jgi:hypothetical protein